MTADRDALPSFSETRVDAALTPVPAPSGGWRADHGAFARPFDSPSSITAGDYEGYAAIPKPDGGFVIKGPDGGDVGVFTPPKAPNPPSPPAGDSFMLPAKPGKLADGQGSEAFYNDNWDFPTLPGDAGDNDIEVPLPDMGPDDGSLPPVIPPSVEDLGDAGWLDLPPPLSLDGLV